MAVSDEQIAFVRDLFGDLPAITTRKMFGGVSVYSEGTIFAIIGPEDALLLKAKGDLAQDLSENGCTQWVYADTPGKPSKLPYWTFPDSALDDTDDACRWARRSLQQHR